MLVAGKKVEITAIFKWIQAAVYVHFEKRQHNLQRN